jgi:ParB family chromosome partitioning protein
MFAKKMLKELLEKGIFDTLSNDYQSFGVIEDTLYIALRKGEDKPVNEREIVSIAKYKGDRLNYVAGSNTKVTIPMIHMEESAVIGHLTFLSDPLSAYVHHILYGASIIHLQRSEESKLDKYSEDILSHIGDNNYNLFCTKEEFGRVTQLLLDYGYEKAEGQNVFKNPQSEILFSLQPGSVLDDEIEYTGKPDFLSMLKFAEEKQLKYKSFYSSRTRSKYANRNVNLKNAYEKFYEHAEYLDEKIKISSTTKVLLKSIAAGEMDISRIKLLYQPRMKENYDEDRSFQELKKSIEEMGIISPIIIRGNARYVAFEGQEYIDDDEITTYELIDGHRRLAAAQAIGMTKVPVTVVDVNEENALVLSILSNTKRENLSIIEQGFAYKKLIEQGLFKTQRDLAKQFGIDESTVATTINHLKLDRRIIDDLIKNKSISDQRILKSIRSVEKVNEDSLSDTQWKIYQHIVAKGMGRKDAMKYIKELKGQNKSPEPVQIKRTENSINVAVDIRGLDDNKISKIDALLAEIEAIRTN